MFNIEFYKQTLSTINNFKCLLGLVLAKYNTFDQQKNILSLRT